MKQIVGVFKCPNIEHNYGVHFCFESRHCIRVMRYVMTSDEIRDDE